MICPNCNNENGKSSVYAVRRYKDRIIRYRECKNCKHKFKSIEKTQSGWDYEDAILRIKKIVDGF